MKLNICLFDIKGNKLIQKDYKIWDKVSKIIKKRSDSEPAYNE